MKTESQFVESINELILVAHAHSDALATVWDKAPIIGLTHKQLLLTAGALSEYTAQLTNLRAVMVNAYQLETESSVCLKLKLI